MKDITLTGADPGEYSAVALGIFDGVHRGHRRVLETAFSCEGLTRAVFTFDTGTVDTKGEGYKMLITDDFKRSLLRRAGAESIFSPDFHTLKNMEAEDFARLILRDKMHAKVCVCGEKFRFGHGAKGDSEALIRYGRRYGFDVKVVERLDDNGKRISSSLIRSLVREGDVREADRLLGYNYGYCLEVVHGNHLGTTIDFPTINQQLPESLVLPRFGVYVSGVHIDGRVYAGVTNIGVKPTVGQDTSPLAETYIIDFSGDLYGRVLEIELYDFIRPERRFDSFDALKAEIKKNTLQAKAIFENMRGN